MHLTKLLNDAYGNAATVGIAKSGFCATRIKPVNRHVFKNDQFLAADVLQASERHIETSDSDDDDGNNAPRNDNKQFKEVLEELSPRAKKTPNPDGPSFFRAAPIAQEAVEISCSL